MAQPWERDWSGAQPSTPGPVLGPPPKVDPYRDADEARKQAAEQRAREDQDLQRKKFELDQVKLQRDPKTTESENKAGSFLIRALGANDSYEGTGVGPRSLPGQILKDTAPNVLNVLPAAIGNSQQRQVADSAQDEFIAATLRQDSGAAIPEDELERQRRIYFPMPGDSDAAIEQKRQARIRAIEGLKMSAGRLEGDALERYNRLVGGDQKQDQNGTANVSMPSGGNGAPPAPIGGGDFGPGMEAVPEWWDRTAWLQRTHGITPEQEQQQIAFWTGVRGNPNLSPDAVKQVYTQNGWPVPDDATISQWIGYANEGRAFTGFDDNADMEARKKELEGLRGEFDPASAGSYLDRAGQGLTLGFADELDGIDAASNALFQGGDLVKAYRDGRDTTRLSQEQMSDAQGWLGTGAEVLGSIPTTLALPGGRSASVGGAAKNGVISGALFGAGNAKTTADIPRNALIGSVVGGTAGAGAQAGVNKLIARSAAKAPAKNALIPYADDVVKAGNEFNVPVMTSDVRPPKTAVGRTGRMIGDSIPLAGTGGKRSAQDEARQTAVETFVKDYGPGKALGAAEEVAKDLAKTRGAQIQSFTTAKDRVIDGIKGAVPMPRTIDALDAQIAKLQSANPDAFAPVIKEMLNFKKVFSSGKSLRDIEMNRRLLGDMFEDASLAKIRGDGQKAINALYKPLKQDMGDFIRTNGGDGAFNVWTKADLNLSKMAKELDGNVFKRVLNNAKTTPEDAAKILFGQTPSDMKRLFGNLSDAGKIKARAAIILKAAEGATADDVISPKRFANALKAMDEATGVFFEPAEKAKIEGLRRLLNATQHGANANAMPLTGASNRVVIGGIGGAQLLGGATLPVSGFAGLIARAYESKASRNLLMSLGRSKPGSKAESAIMQRIAQTLRTPETAMTAANDISGRFASAPSTTAAAASENEKRGWSEPIGR